MEQFSIVKICRNITSFLKFENEALRLLLGTAVLSSKPKRFNCIFQKVTLMFPSIVCNIIVNINNSSFFSCVRRLLTILHTTLFT